MMTVSYNRPFAYFVGLLIVASTTWTFDTTISICTYLSKLNDTSDITVLPSWFSPPQMTPTTIDDDISEDNKHLLLHEFRNYLIQDHNHDDDDKKTMFLQGLIAALQQESNHQNEGDESNRSNDCPLDWIIFNSTTNCIRNNERKSICPFEGLVFKRINVHNAPRYEKYYYTEKKAFQVLKNETKFFPKLYYMNDQCSTMIIEDIKPFREGMKEGHNYWTADYSYYEDFFIKAFDVFNSRNVHPNDISACCNTVVNGEYIKIFDFDRYHMIDDKVELAELNEELLKNLLTSIKKKTMKQHDMPHKHTHHVSVHV